MGTILANSAQSLAGRLQAAGPVYSMRKAAFLYPPPPVEGSSACLASLHAVTLHRLSVSVESRVVCPIEAFLDSLGG